MSDPLEVAVVVLRARGEDRAAALAAATAIVGDVLILEDVERLLKKADNLDLTALARERFVQLQKIDPGSWDRSRRF